MKFLITGGCGFLGSNLAQEAISRGHELAVLDNLSRVGSELNLKWLQSLSPELKHYSADIRNQDDVNFIIEEYKPDVIFHLAGQVAVTTSLARPRFDFEINVLGTFNVLLAAKDHCPEAAIFYSSTNKVYGDLEDLEMNESELRYDPVTYKNGLPESVPLDFSTPYGCSKGAAEQYMKDFASCFALKTVVFRHSSIYGNRQFSTFDQGWVGWFVQQAINTIGDKNNSYTISGTGKQVRDLLYSEDIISCYFLALEHIDKIKGQAFNIGGGVENSLSLLELFKLLESELDIKLNFEKLAFRAHDQRYFAADITKAHDLFGWKPKVSSTEGVRNMINWVKTIKEL